MPRPPSLPVAVAILLAILAVAAPRAARADPGAPAILQVVARDEGPAGSHNERAFWLEVQGLDGRNPDLRLAAGPLTVTFRNAGSRPHSLHVDAPWGGQTPLLDPNATWTLHLDVPAGDGAGTYYCDAHREVGMGGRWVTGNATAGAFPGMAQQPGLLPGAGLPGLALALASAGALVAWRRR